MDEGIYCLFSIENNYDQPRNNLECWWPVKPTIEQICSAMKWKLTGSDETIIAIARIWDMQGASLGGTDYRLQYVKPRVQLENN